MNNIKRARTLGKVLILLGIVAFGFDLLCDQNYLPADAVLDYHFTCGFSGLGMFVLGTGIGEWARQRQMDAKVSQG